MRDRHLAFFVFFLVSANIYRADCLTQKGMKSTKRECMSTHKKEEVAYTPMSLARVPAHDSAGKGACDDCGMTKNLRQFISAISLLE